MTGLGQASMAERHLEGSVAAAADVGSAHWWRALAV